MVHRLLIENSESIWHHTFSSGKQFRKGRGAVVKYMIFSGLRLHEIKKVIYRESVISKKNLVEKCVHFQKKPSFHFLGSIDFSFVYEVSKKYSLCRNIFYKLILSMMSSSRITGPRSMIVFSIFLTSSPSIRGSI